MRLPLFPVIFALKPPAAKCMRARMKMSESNVRDACAELLTNAQFCLMLDISDRTAAIWRRDGTSPPYIRIGPRRVYYRRADVEVYLATRTFPHRAAEAA